MRTPLRLRALSLVPSVLVMSAAALLTARDLGLSTGSWPASGFAPGARVQLDAHNAYPSDGRFANRLDRALATGLPVAIEQDLVWYVDPATHTGRSVVSHGGSDTATAPRFED